MLVALSCACLSYRPALACLPSCPPALLALPLGLPARPATRLASRLAARFPASPNPPACTAWPCTPRLPTGGPVYVSDRPGMHDFSLLRRLVLPDGSGAHTRCIRVLCASCVHPVCSSCLLVTAVVL